jgi:uncharacterized integral membrane protein
VSKFKSAAVILTLVLALIVIFQNTETVTTRILFVSIEMPRVLLLAIMVIFGVILGFAGATKWRKGADKTEEKSKD